MKREVKMDEVGMVELKGSEGERLGAVRLFLHTETTNKPVLDAVHPMMVRAMSRAMEAYAKGVEDAVRPVIDKANTMG